MKKTMFAAWTLTAGLSLLALPTLAAQNARSARLEFPYVDSCSGRIASMSEDELLEWIPNWVDSTLRQVAATKDRLDQFDPSVKANFVEETVAAAQKAIELLKARKEAPTLQGFSEWTDLGEAGRILSRKAKKNADIAEKEKYLRRLIRDVRSDEEIRASQRC